MHSVGTVADVAKGWSYLFTKKGLAARKKKGRMDPKYTYSDARKKRVIQKSNGCLVGATQNL